MIVEKQKARATLLARRKKAIIISLIAVVVLIALAVVITPYANTHTFEDADGNKYTIKYRKGEFSLYDTDGEEITRESTYNYFATKNGTLINLDTETGEYKIVGVPDTEGTESVDNRNGLLLFRHISKDDIRSIEVHNASGEYKMLRYNIATASPDDNGEFVIEESPLTAYDQDLFASFYVSAGYSLAERRIVEPIKDENGEYTEYGLVPEDRVDDEGNPYRYEPAYYIITDKSGKSHKVIIGDALTTGGGYYAQYVDITDGKETKRDAVYVFVNSIAEPLLEPIETLVSPTIVEGISLNNYYDVENFKIHKYNNEGTPENIVGFTFIDLAERQNTIYASRPFIFDNEALKSYIPNTDVIFESLMNFYSPEFAGVACLAPTNDEFISYGLGKYEVGETGEEAFKFTPKYAISFDCEPLGPNGTKLGAVIREILFISEKNEAGNYYVYSFFYDAKSDELLYTSNMICEVMGHCLDFVDYKTTKWINSGYIDLNIAFCDEIKLETKDYSANFKLDNSASDMSAQISSELLTVSASDSKGNKIDTFSSLTVTDTRGFVWTITPTKISAVNAKGEASTISSSYYAYNKLGRNVMVINGYIDCVDGSQVKVTTDEVIVTDSSGNVTTYVRYASTLFRLYYQTLLVASIIDSYELSPEEEVALLADESKKLLTITIRETENAYGTADDGLSYPEDYTTTYEFYELTTRKAYIVINGVGGFYVNTDRVGKLVSDAEKFFALEMINATSKK